MAWFDGRTVRSVPGVLLQRDTELAALGRQLIDVRAGTGRVIIVDGPAGIGKSSLLAATAATARASGMRTLRAAGNPLESDAGLYDCQGAEPALAASSG